MKYIEYGVYTGFENMRVDAEILDNAIETQADETMSNIVKENDTLLNVVRKSHPVRYVEEKDGRFFGVIEDFIDYISHHPVVIDKNYYYQVFNTECFLLVSAPYRICFNRQPLLSFGDRIYRDFWLDPDSPQKVVVVIPLICDNN